MLPPRSQLAQLTKRDAFWWATGIEDTFITAPWPASGRTLDEYELTGHYAQWETDLQLVQSLGVSCARYGLPWYRINPAPGRWEWDFADAALNRLLELGVDPIVDLVHYGVPAWMEDAFLHPDYPDYVAEYGARLADRFRGRIRWYTPKNEPRIAAWYCGRLGWWPPFRRNWRGFLQVLLAISKGVVRTCEELRKVDPEAVMAHVDATDLYIPIDPALAEVAAHRQQLVFLALDLISGRVTASHPLRPFMRRHGVTDAQLDWFQERRIDLDVLGLNLYPMFTQKHLLKTARGFRMRMSYAGGDLLEELAVLYWERYQKPLMITETASVGSVGRRMDWLRDSVAAVRRTRARGIPLVGYTWWPMFSLIGWAYRQGSNPLETYLMHMGLWDLDPAPEAHLRRRATPLVEAYRELAMGNAETAGMLEPYPHAST